MHNRDDASDDITRSSREAWSRGLNPKFPSRRIKYHVTGKNEETVPPLAPGQRASLLDSSWRQGKQEVDTSNAMTDVHRNAAVTDEYGDELVSSRGATGAREGQPRTTPQTPRGTQQAETGNPSQELSQRFLRLAAAKGKHSAWGRGPWDVRRLELRARRGRIRDAKHEVAQNTAGLVATGHGMSEETSSSGNSAEASTQSPARDAVSDIVTAAGSKRESMPERHVTREKDINTKTSATQTVLEEISRRPLAEIDQQRMRKVEPARALSDHEEVIFERMAREHSNGMPKSPVDARSKGAKSSEGAISILQELFPKELSRKTQAQLHKTERHVPRVPMELPASKNLTLESAYEMREDRDLIQKVHPSPGVNENLALLILRKASKHLTEKDFHRLVPSGKHIEGWTAAGRLIQIIRAREMDTLQPTGDYFLVFSNKAIASRYLEHATELHEHSRYHSPRSTSKSLPPAPTLSRGSRAKFVDPAYTYNLVPSSHELSMRVVDQPFSYILQRIVADGGYPRLVAHRQSSFEVFLSFTSSFRPSFTVLRRCIDQDGKERGSFWQTTGENYGIRMLDDEAAKSAPGAPEEGEAEAFDADGNRKREWRQRGAFGARRFIVSFKDNEEATRFVMSWHQRDVTHLMEGRMMEPWRGAPIVSQAELIW